MPSRAKYHRKGRSKLFLKPHQPSYNDVKEVPEGVGTGERHSEAQKSLEELLAEMRREVDRAASEEATKRMKQATNKVRAGNRRKAHYQTKLMQQRKRYWDEERDWRQEAQAEYRSTARGKWSYLKKNSKQRGLEFDLPWEWWVENYQEGKWCKRKDTSRGYTVDNTYWE
jgi:hypothetical protein